MRHRLSILLMILSLVLLAVFLLFFLKKTYENERGELQKEVGYLFINSVRSIEGDMLDKFIFRRIVAGSDSLEEPHFLPMPQHDSGDSLQVITFIGDRKGGMQPDSTLRIRIKTGEGVEDNVSKMTGSLSIVISMSGGKAAFDSVHIKTDSTSLLPLLKSHFEEAMQTAKLPIDYHVVNWHTDSLQPRQVLLSGSYTDLPSGEQYAAELTDYQGFLLKKMLPQILFSIGLFACVTLAFFTVFKSLQAQERLTELKNDFIRNVTHELKTPIATVGVAIEALRDFDALKSPDRTREYLDISKNELNRLSLLVDKVLRMSLFEKMAPELKLEPVDMKALVEEVLSSMKLQFEKARARVDFHCEGENFTLQGDRLHLASVVYNLLDNALKYSQHQPQIQITLDAGNGQIQLRVSDNGMGIPPEFQGKIFEKFFRVPSGDVHNVKGHGLGLSYVASVVKKHGGRIETESRVGEGTTFRVILPA